MVGTCVDGKGIFKEIRRPLSSNTQIGIYLSTLLEKSMMLKSRRQVLLAVEREMQVIWQLRANHS